MNNELNEAALMIHITDSTDGIHGAGKQGRRERKMEGNK